MRRCRRALVVPVLVLLSFVAAGPASAGGPTSALVVQPDAGRTAALYASDADYLALADLVGAFEPSGLAGTVDKTGADHESGSYITVTWLIHDVSVWRVDRIFVDADGGPWISTQLSRGETASLGDPGTWHTASDGYELRTLLDGLGVGPGDGGGSDVTVPGDDQAAQPATAATEPAATETAAGGSAGPGRLVWGLAGLVLGATLAVLALRLSSSTRREPVELVDMDVA